MRVVLTLIAAPAVDSALRKRVSPQLRAKTGPGAGYTARSLDEKRAMQIDAPDAAARGRATDRQFHLAGSSSLQARPARERAASIRISTPEPPVRHAREAEVEVGMLPWVPGQSRRCAKRSIARCSNWMRELRCAGRTSQTCIRDAWWNVQRTARELEEIERERVATARDIEHDIRRRSGDTAHQDKLLARNETLSAENRIHARRGLRAARDAFAGLTGGPYVEGASSRRFPMGPDGHPAVRAATGRVPRAEANADCRCDADRESEVGAFGRRDYSASGWRAKAARRSASGFAPPPTAGRNEPAEGGKAETGSQKPSLRRPAGLFAAGIAAARRR